MLRLTPGRSSVDCPVEVSPIPKIHQSVQRRSLRASISILGGGKIVLYNILSVKLYVKGSSATFNQIFLRVVLIFVNTSSHQCESPSGAGEVLSGSFSNDDSNDNKNVT